MEKPVALEIKPFSVTSLFAGCGGFDLGFLGGFEFRDQAIARTRFNIAAAYDIDAHCEVTYKLNIGSQFTKCDLSSYPAANITKAEVLIGGFPCQDFSHCGPRKGLKSARGRLYKALVDYCKIHQPKLFVAENVSNLATMESGKILETIIADFKAVGYRVAHWSLYAPDYGVPQARNRIFIIGVRKDLPGFPALPHPAFASNHRTVKWAIGDLENISDDTIANQSQYFKAKRAINGHGQGDEISQADKPGYTVRANAKSRVHFHYALPRRLTIRECARLQTFPDSFAFPHSATTNLMQIGNAVPPLLAYAVAVSCQSYLESIHNSQKKAA